MALKDEIKLSLTILDHIITVLDDMKTEGNLKAAQKFKGTTSISQKDWIDTIAWLDAAIKNEKKYRADFVNALSARNLLMAESSANNVHESFKYFSDMDLSWSKYEPELEKNCAEYSNISRWTLRVDRFDRAICEQLERELGWR
jgi:hypothetical protein